ncbi:MFS transporter [Macrococcoides caseolyticum]|uniref:MFS transporter n=1 Tax=Macrococcoides caseolyticum TaxID=69966 RepID=UPI001F2050BB|nr:MFS transporter [Macrococcus caseolyticus]MCE4957297.1 MFS transporter [Macrococcus caseolyticus]
MSRLKLFTFILSIFVVGMVELVVAGILTLMSDDLNISQALTGQLITIYAFTVAICGPILVKMTEQYNPKWVLLISMIIFIIGNSINALGDTFAIIVIGRIIASAASSIIVVKLLALTVVLSAPEVRGKMLGLVYIGFSGANVFGVPIATKIGEMFGWRATFLMIVVVSIVATIMLMFQLPNKIDTTDNNQNKHSRLLYPKEAAKYIGITFFILASNYIVFTYISPMMLNEGYTLAHVSILLFVCGLGSIAGTSLGGIMADKIGSKKWLIIALSIFTLSLLLFNVALPFYIPLLIVMLAWNIFEWGTNPAIQIGIIKQVEGDSSSIMAWNMSALNAGIGFGALMGGIVVEAFSPAVSPYLSTVLALICLGLAFSIQRD